MNTRKSKKIGNIYGQFELMDTVKKNGETKWIVRCLKCGTIQEKCRHSVERCVTECEVCGKPKKGRNSCGHYKERLYHIYTTMIQRTTNPKKQGYERYGGRGISVCEAWADDFMLFYAWSMNNGYDETKTIDRIDNDGNYTPKNCRWVDAKAQSNNRSSNLFFEINGEKKTVAEWAEAYGVDRHLVYNRLRIGWPIVKALTEPVDKSKWSRSKADS